MSLAAPSLQKVLDDARWLLTKVQAQETAASGLEQCASELRLNLQRSNEVQYMREEASSLFTCLLLLGHIDKGGRLRHTTK